MPSIAINDKRSRCSVIIIALRFTRTLSRLVLQCFHCSQIRDAGFCLRHVNRQNGRENCFVTELYSQEYNWRFHSLSEDTFYRHSYDPKDIKCLIGGHKRNSTADTSTIDIDKIHIHPNYTGMTTSWQYDIAILSLHEDITFNTFAQPICIPDTELTEGDMCVATGWGRNGG